jgi:hypothetical protein
MADRPGFGEVLRDMPWTPGMRVTKPPPVVTTSSAGKTG